MMKTDHLLKEIHEFSNKTVFVQSVYCWVYDVDTACAFHSLHLRQTVDACSYLSCFYNVSSSSACVDCRLGLCVCLLCVLFALGEVRRHA